MIIKIMTILADTIEATNKAFVRLEESNGVPLIRQMQE